MSRLHIQHPLLQILRRSLSVGPCGPMAVVARSLALVYACVCTSPFLRVGAQTEGSLLWAGPFTTGGYIVSSPAIGADGTIYFGSQDKHLYAVAPGGALKWRFATGDWVDATPAIGADGTIYFGSWDGKLYALAPSGVKKWEYSVGSGNYIYSSPAIGSDGTIYFGGGDANLHALNPDGSLKWTYPTGDWIDSSPAIGLDGRVFFGSWDGFVYALDDEGGRAREVWRHATNGPVIGSPAIGRDGTVYVGSNDGRLYAIDGVTGARRWDVQVGGAIEGAPALGPDGAVYVGAGAGRLLALNTDGTTRWSFGTVDPVVSSPAVRADGVILFGSDAGFLHALNPDGSPRWRLSTGDWVDSSPVIAPNGTLFVGSYDKKLYALNGNGAPASAFSDWPLFRGAPSRSGRMPSRPTGGRLVNLSTRAEAGRDTSLILGFGIAGSSPRSLLVRAVGPTLADLGVRAPLADPRLELHTMLERGDTVLATNDDWGAGRDADRIAEATLRTGAFALPAASRDAALLLEAEARPHSAMVFGANGSGGPALVEIYDAGPSAAGLGLSNLSTRARIASGGEPITLGFVVGGTGSVRLLLRAVGPALARWGVPSPLARPALTLFSGSTPIATNAGWSSSTQAADLAGAAAAARAFDLDPGSADCALLATLLPGAYTLQITGRDGATGEVLGEIYALP